MKIKQFFIILLLLISAGLFSCVNKTSPTTTWSNGTETFAISGTFAKNVVRIYDSDEPLGSGVIIGDGSLVLTAIDYMDYSPGLLKVLVPGQGAFDAVIQSIDPRTSLTLIKMSGYNLSGAALGDSSTIKPKQKVIVCEWTYNYTDGAFDFQEEHMLIREAITDLQFNVNWTTENMPNIDSGAVVFSESGEVMGIVGVTLGFIQGPHIPPVADINSAKYLISGDTEQQPWYRGPTLLYTRSFWGEGSSLGYVWGYPGNYAEVVHSINNVIHNLGIPATAGEPVKNMSEVKGGTILFAVYAWPVPLYNGDEVVGTAKWMGFQKPDWSPEFTRLYYGNTFYDIDGAFEINAVIPLPSKY